MAQHNNQTPAACLQSHCAQIEHKDFKARRLGANDPAVLLLDPSDRPARTMPETTSQGDKIAEHSAEDRRRSFGSSMTLGYPSHAGDRTPGKILPAVAASIALPLDGGYFRVAVGSTTVGMVSPIRETNIGPHERQRQPVRSGRHDGTGRRLRCRRHLDQTRASRDSPRVSLDHEPTARPVWSVTRQRGPRRLSAYSL